MVGKLIFRRPCDPVDADWQRVSAVGLYGYIETGLMQLFYQCIIDLQRWLATCENDKAARAPLTDGLDNLVGRHRLIVAEVSVAERTTQVATAEAYKDRGTSGVSALTLKGIEYFVDSIHHSR
jgi:hypothetical protein